VPLVTNPRKARRQLRTVSGQRDFMARRVGAAPVVVLAVVIAPAREEYAGCGPLLGGGPGQTFPSV